MDQSNFLKIFLDVNTFIDVIELRDEAFATCLIDKSIFISAYSMQVLSYIYKYKIPEEKLSLIPTRFNLIFSDSKIVAKALLGPTEDFEDNIQLHSAVEAACDVFLTRDKELLKMGYFGKTRLAADLAFS